MTPLEAADCCTYSRHPAKILATLAFGGAVQESSERKERQTNIPLLSSCRHSLPKSIVAFLSTPMKTSTPFNAASSFLAAPLIQHVVYAQVHFPFARQSTHQAALQRRSIPVNFFGAEWTYVVNATVGTPPQDLSFSLTVSADESWVPDAEYCDPDSELVHYDSGGCPYGSFDLN
ncbi:hypothetical protein BJ170DRAFT_103428 [Xylariales sp. AK1849]|nr:hypothetical protein BJ170DRAFT_103428 [Xylariales sp. AK1849]